MSNFGQESSQDFELNIAPIIDCFTVLITYLLVTASFISLTVLEVGVASAGSSAPATAPIEIPVSVGLQLSESHLLTIKISGKNIDETIPVPAKATKWDVDLLGQKLETIKKNYTKVEDISVTSEPKVIYKEIIEVIEAVKKTFEKVYLAG